MNTRWLWLILLLALSLASCVPPVAGSVPAKPQETPSKELPTASTETSLQFDNTPAPQEMSSTPAPAPAQKFIALAKENLAERLNVEVDSIKLVSISEITWPNAALGCPSPGKVYAQGRVPGYQIRLEAGGAAYVYHTDLSGQMILCPQHDPDDLDSLLSPTAGPTSQIGVPIK